jgi:hypothetical protein
MAREAMIAKKPRAVRARATGCDQLGSQLKLPALSKGRTLETAFDIRDSWYDMKKG